MKPDMPHYWRDLEAARRGAICEEKAANDNTNLKKLAERFMQLFGKKDGNGNPRHANDNKRQR